MDRLVEKGDVSWNVSGQSVSFFFLLPVLYFLPGYELLFIWYPSDV